MGKAGLFAGKQLLIILIILIVGGSVINFLGKRFVTSFLEENIPKFEIPPFEGEPNKISGSKFQSLVTTINGCFQVMKKVVSNILEKYQAYQTHLQSVIS